MKKLYWVVWALMTLWAVVAQVFVHPPHPTNVNTSTIRDWLNQHYAMALVLGAVVGILFAWVGSSRIRHKVGERGRQFTSRVVFAGLWSAVAGAFLASASITLIAGSAPFTALAPVQRMLLVVGYVLLVLAPVA